MDESESESDEVVVGVEALAAAGVLDALVARLSDTVDGEQGLKRKRKGLRDLLLVVKQKHLPEMEDRRLDDRTDVLGRLESALRTTLGVLDRIGNIGGISLDDESRRLRALRTTLGVVDKIGLEEEVAGRINSFVKGRRLCGELDDSISQLEQLLGAFQEAHGGHIATQALERGSAQDDVADMETFAADLVIETESSYPQVKESATLFKAFIMQFTVGELRRRMDIASDAVHRETGKFCKTISLALDKEKANIPPEQLVVSEGDVLGQGGLGQVLVATLNGKAVAVRRVPAKRRKQIEGWVELREAAETWKRIAPQQNIVELLGTAVKGGQLCLVMERCDVSLHVLLHEHTAAEAPVSEDAQIAVLKGIACGLAHLHSMHLLHGDLKPRNVLLTGRGGVKLTDFGMAVEGLGSRAYAYKAPEVLAEPLMWTSRADVFSFAVTCWELLHRAEPWTGVSERDVVAGVLAGERPAVDSSVPAYEWASPLVMACWGLTRQSRPLASEVLETLERETRREGSADIVRELLGFIGLPGAKAKSQTEAHGPTATKAKAKANAKAKAKAKANATAEAKDESAKAKDESAKAKAESATAEAESAKATPGAELVGAEAVAAAAICMELGDLAINSNVSAQLMLAGAGKQICVAMSAHVANDTVQSEGCSAFSRLAKDTPSVQVHLMRIGAAGVIVQAMSAHRDAPRVQAEGCSALWQLSKNGANAVELMRANAGRAVIIAMGRPFAKAPLLRTGCAVVGNLAGAPLNRAPLVTLGGPNVVLAAMRAHPADPGVQGNGCGALGCLESPATKAKLMSLGVGSAIVEAMRAHVSEPRVQEYGCRAVVKLSSEGEEGNAVGDDTNRELLGLGAASAIAVGMRAHRSDVGVQQHALGALYILASTSGAEKQLLEAGALDCVVKAMRAHPADADVLVIGCCALQQLSFGVKSSAQLMALGAPKVVLEALGAFPANLHVAMYGCGALWNLSRTKKTVAVQPAGVNNNEMDKNKDEEEGASQTRGDDGDHNAQLMALDAADAVVKAMNAHRGEAHVLESAFGVLQNLAAYGNKDKDVARMPSATASAVLEGMRAHPDDPIVQQCACGTLREFAANSANNAARLMVLGAADEILKATKAHSEEACSQEEAFATLEELVRGFDLHRDDLRATGAADVVIAALRAFPEDAQVQKHGLELLLLLATTVQGAKHAHHAALVAKGVGPLAKKALEMHPDTTTATVAQHVLDL